MCLLTECLQGSGLGAHRARATDFGYVCTPSDGVSTVWESTQGSGRWSTGLGLPILDLEVHMPMKNYGVHYNANLDMSRRPP